jgi:hypothetical protein
MKRIFYAILYLLLLSGCTPDRPELPELPVSVSFRTAMMGPGNVAVFNTTIKSPISVLVIVESAALGTKKQFELHLDPTRPSELGHLEGVVIESGDVITVQNQKYAPIRVRLN